MIWQINRTSTHTTRSVRRTVLRLLYSRYCSSHLLTWCRYDVTIPIREIWVHLADTGAGARMTPRC